MSHFQRIAPDHFNTIVVLKCYNTEVLEGEKETAETKTYPEYDTLLELVETVESEIRLAKHHFEISSEIKKIFFFKIGLC